MKRLCIAVLFLIIIVLGYREAITGSPGTISKEYMIQSFTPVAEGPITKNWGIILQMQNDGRLIFVDLCTVAFLIKIDPLLSTKQYRVVIEKMESVAPTNEYFELILAGIVTTGQVILYVSSEEQRQRHSEFIYFQKLYDYLGQPVERKCHPKKMAFLIYLK